MVSPACAGATCNRHGQFQTHVSPVPKLLIVPGITLPPKKSNGAKVNLGKDLSGCSEDTDRLEAGIRGLSMEINESKTDVQDEPRATCHTGK